MMFWLLLMLVIYLLLIKGWFSVLVNWNLVMLLLVMVWDLVMVGMVLELVGFWWVSGLMVILLLLGWLFYCLVMLFIVECMSS